MSNPPEDLPPSYAPGAPRRPLRVRKQAAQPQPKPARPSQSAAPAATPNPPKSAAPSSATPSSATPNATARPRAYAPRSRTGVGAAANPRATPRPSTPNLSAAASSGGADKKRPHSYARPGSSAVPLDSSPRFNSTRRLPAKASSAPSALPPRYQRTAPPQPAANPLPARQPGSFPQTKPPIAPTAPPARRRKRRHPWRWLAAILILILVLVGGRCAWLIHNINKGLNRVDALTQTANTADGETWLIVGSDARGENSGTIQDETSGARADSIMILNQAPNGQTTLTSLPRDTYVNIPDYGDNKINASYSYGGAQLLVQTVEKLSGLSVDHYTEVGMGAVEELVTAVGGVNVCLDYDVNDTDSGLVWDTSLGTCQDVDGTKALAYSRMRKSDPTGDIGRGLRQRAVVSAVVSKAMSASTLFSFSRQNALVAAGTQALTVDQDASALSLAKMAWAFRSASKAALTGAPPIESLDYEPGNIGAAVLLQDTTAPDFFAKLRAGTLTSSDFYQAQ